MILLVIITQALKNSIINFNTNYVYIHQYLVKNKYITYYEQNSDSIISDTVAVFIYYRTHESKKGCNRMSETHPITTRLRLIIQAQE